MLPTSISAKIYTAIHHTVQIVLDYAWFIRHSLPFPYKKIERLRKLPWFKKGHSAEAVSEEASRFPHNNPTMPTNIPTQELTKKSAPLLVFLPGIYEGTYYFRKLKSYLPEYDMIDIPQLRGMNLPVPTLAKRVIDEVKTIKRPIIFIAHSKGGLIGRAVLAAQLPHIYGMVAFATPWNGSTRAALFPSRHPLHELIPHGQDVRIPWSSQLEKHVEERIVSLSPHWDFHVPQGSFLLGASNIQLSQSGHFRPLYHSDGIASVRAAITELCSHIHCDSKENK